MINQSHGSGIDRHSHLLGGIDIILIMAAGWAAFGETGMDRNSFRMIKENNREILATFAECPAVDSALARKTTDRIGWGGGDGWKYFTVPQGRKTVVLVGRALGLPSAPGDASNVGRWPKTAVWRSGTVRTS